MRLLNRFAVVACLVAVVGVMSRGEEPTPFAPKSMRLDKEVLYAAPGNTNYAYGPKGEALNRLTAGDRPATATFQVTYVGFSTEAQAAFQAAVNIWSAALTSTVPIRVTARFTPLGTGVLGSAGASSYCTVTGGVANTYYPAPLADKINGTAYCAALGGATDEIEANFNSTFTGWEYGTSGVGVAGKYNFLTVVMHELGHGLGLAGAFTSSGGIGNLCCGFPQPTIYDRFPAGGGTLLVNIARPSAALHAQLVGNNTFWTGTNGNNAKIETHNFDTTYGYNTGSGQGFQQGSSYSHLDDILYTGTPNGLMTFALGANEVYTDPGPLMRAMFLDEGWTISTTPPPATPRVFGDFNGDGLADLAVFRPSSGQWFINGISSPQFGLTGDIPVPGDYNNDGTTEVAVYRPSTGVWYFAVGSPASVQFGRSGDIPVPADYDNDKKTDLAVFRTTDNDAGVWFVNGVVPRTWGVRGDIPMPADYDNDGRADLAVFRPSTGQWFINFSATGFTTSSSTAFGLPGDIPVRADFDADGRTDFVVYRPSSGQWFLSQTTAGAASFVFGLSGDMPLAIDTDGDGRPEAAVYRPSTGQWFTFNRTTSASAVNQFGIPGDIPVTARPRLPAALNSDFDGDGRSEISVYRPSTGQWFTRYSSTGFATTAAPQWGLSGDVRAPGDYDGDRRTDLAVYRPSNGQWFVFQSATGTVLTRSWGLSSDTPMPADYDGDGRTDIAVYRPSTGNWYVLTSSSNFTVSSVTQWGISSDKPVAADFDGDGRADFAVYRPSTGEWFLRPTTAAYGPFIIRQWGLSSDVPVASDFDGDGRADLAVYRPSSGQWFILDPITGVSRTPLQWGLVGDAPNPHDYDGDGITDTAIYRTASGEWFVRQSSNGAVIFFQWGLSSDVPNGTERGGSSR